MQHLLGERQVLLRRVHPPRRSVRLGRKMGARRLRDNHGPSRGGRTRQCSLGLGKCASGGACRGIAAGDGEARQGRAAQHRQHQRSAGGGGRRAHSPRATHHFVGIDDDLHAAAAVRGAQQGHEARAALRHAQPRGFAARRRGSRRHAAVQHARRASTRAHHGSTAQPAIPRTGAWCPRAAAVMVPPLWVGVHPAAAG